MGELIGLIGGTGAYAGVALLYQLFKTTGAKKDQDFAEVIMHSNPMIADRTSHLLYGGQNPTKELLRSARMLESAGAKTIIIGCVTAHAYIEELQCHLKTAKIVNVLERTVRFLQNDMPEVRRVGILCSEGAAKTGIWEKALADSGIIPHYLSDIHQSMLFDNVIYGDRSIKAGCFDSFNRSKIEQALGQLEGDGADVGIGSCSELPLVLQQDAHDKYIDVFYITIRQLLEENR